VDCNKYNQANTIHDDGQRMADLPKWPVTYPTHSTGLANKLIYYFATANCKIDGLILIKRNKI